MQLGAALHAEAAALERSVREKRDALCAAEADASVKARLATEAEAARAR